MNRWIDTHCHLDAPEFGAQTAAVRERARALGVTHCVLPAVEAGNFDAVRDLAHRFGDSYALGIHPLFVKDAQDGDLDRLDAALTAAQGAPRLVAVGEIGIDLFVPELTREPLRERQTHFYRQQLLLARKHGLPVILHVRRSADLLLKSLRELRPAGGWLGIAHAFNGSEQQAMAFIDLGLKLGFGGAVTFERALQLRRLAATLPLDALVLETDAPDIPPHWLYVNNADRAAGVARRLNEPGELPRIATEVARLRGMAVEDLALAMTRNAVEALPGLAKLLP